MKTKDMKTQTEFSAAGERSLLRRVAAITAMVLPLLALSAGGSTSRGVSQPVAGSTPPLPLIAKGNIQIELQTVASGLTAPVDLQDANDGSGRLFIVEQVGRIKILQGGVVLSTPFLDVTDRLVEIMPEYDERGLLGLAFHPDFNNASAAGYHKLYTYTSEPVNGKGDFSEPHRDPFDHQDVVAEWQISASDPNVVDPASRREVVRIDHPQFNHNSGHLLFGPDDHYLYFCDGDGGNANDVGSGHNARIGNGQDLTVILGKMVRIDPLDPSLTTGDRGRVSRNGKYRVPRSNPFFYRPPSIPEIFAYGLRNPFRSSFDPLTHRLIIADVGQDNIEEINFADAGDNFGWNRKEGTFLFDPKDGSIRPDRHPDPTLTEPVAEYSHFDGEAVIGGFVYRGRLNSPVLDGLYVFGDLAPVGETSGRLFYSDLSNGVIFEFIIGPDDVPLGAFLKGFGQDSKNEIYVLDDPNIGPSGTGGEVRKIVSAIIP
jgi:glucose/arabinose dehydrogenase